MALARTFGCCATLAAFLVSAAHLSSGTAGAEPVISDRCTNQINYAFDARSNAEINSIGATTGSCPAPQMFGPEAWSDATLVGQSWMAWMARMLQKASGDSDQQVCTIVVETDSDSSLSSGLDRDDMIAGCVDALKV